MTNSHARELNTSLIRYLDEKRGLRIIAKRNLSAFSTLFSHDSNLKYGAFSSAFAKFSWPNNL